MDEGHPPSINTHVNTPIYKNLWCKLKKYSSCVVICQQVAPYCNITIYNIRGSLTFFFLFFLSDHEEHRHNSDKEDKLKRGHNNQMSEKCLKYRPFSGHIKSFVMTLPPRQAFPQASFMYQKKSPATCLPPPPPTHTHTPPASPLDSWQGMSDMSPVTAGTQIFYLCTRGRFLLHAFFLHLCRPYYVPSCNTV